MLFLEINVFAYFVKESYEGASLTVKAIAIGNLFRLASNKQANAINRSSHYNISDFCAIRGFKAFLEDKHFLSWFKDVHGKVGPCFVNCHDICIVIIVNVSESH